MDFTVSPDSGERLNFSATLPIEYLHYRALPLVYTASGRWGTAIFQELEANGFSVWYSLFFIKENTCLRLEAPIDASTMYLAVKKGLIIEPAGMKRIQLKENQFNLSYFPAIDIRLRFKPGEYAGFAIHLPGAYLHKTVPHLAGLGAFLEHAEKNIGGSLCPDPLYAHPQMLAAINNVLQFNYTNSLGKPYIEYQAPLLLTLALLEMGKKSAGSFVLSMADKAQMEDIRQWLSNNPDNKDGLYAIARRFAINDNKLKRNFRAFSGTTVIHFRWQIRMQRAEKQLLETDMPIAHIAYMAGYTRGAHFSVTFKKWAGYSPSYLRRKTRPAI